jgi:hypothetical protein
MIDSPFSFLLPLHGRYGQFQIYLKLHVDDSLLISGIQKLEIQTFEGFFYSDNCIFSIMVNSEEKGCNILCGDEGLINLLFLHHAASTFLLGAEHRHMRPRLRILKQLN